jgi:hypothetical protein
MLAPGIDRSIVVPVSKLAIRVGSEGSISSEEMLVYQDYVRCGGVLMLLSDAKEPGGGDELAAAFGLQAAGAAARLMPREGGASPSLETYADIPAMAGAPPLLMPNGTGLVGWDDYTVLAGFLGEDTYLDLNGDGLRGDGEPLAAPTLALRPYGQGTVVFLGTTDILDQPDHTLLGLLIRDLMPNVFR